MTRRELMGRIGSDELSEWIAYDQLEPLPDPYWCSALVAYVIAAVNHVKGPKPRFDDFLPRKGPAKPKPARPFTVEDFDRRFGVKPAQGISQ